MSLSTYYLEYGRHVARLRRRRRRAYALTNNAAGHDNHAKINSIDYVKVLLKPKVFVSRLYDLTLSIFIVTLSFFLLSMKMKMCFFAADAGGSEQRIPDV